MRLTRAGVVGVVLVALVLGGCAHRSDPVPDVVDEILQPTGAPSALTPSDASGERTSPDGAWSIVLPESTAEDRLDQVSEGVEEIDFDMPDVDENGLPGVSVSWALDSSVGALEDSAGLELSLDVKPNISELERSEIDWPGADVAVVTTWSEEVLMETGDTLQVETVVLTIESSHGTLVSARAYALAGELEGSTAWEALRTVRLGQG